MCWHPLMYTYTHINTCTCISSHLQIYSTPPNYKNHLSWPNKPVSAFLSTNRGPNLRSPLWVGPMDYPKIRCFGNMYSTTARSREDETLNGQRNANRNPELWRDFRQLHIQIKPRSQSEFAPQDTEEFKSNQNLNWKLYHEIPRNLSFSILTRWIKSPHHLGFRCAFRWPFRFSSTRERAVVEPLL